MTISELIEELQEIRKQFGELPVHIPDYDNLSDKYGSRESQDVFVPKELKDGDIIVEVI